MADSNPYEVADAGNTLPKAGAGKLIGCLLIGGVVIAVLAIMLLPMSRRGREAARRTQCKNNLKQIGLALHYYHDEHDSLPPAFTVDAQGRRLHSWRTLILPYMDRRDIYDQIDLTQPWNSPENLAVQDEFSDLFQCPTARLEPGQTNYLAVAAEGGAFAQPGGLSFAEFKDGITNTMVVLEVDAKDAVPWMSPQDAVERHIHDRREEHSHHQGGFQVLLMDGSVRFVSLKIDKERLTALYTIAGNDEVGDL